MNNRAMLGPQATPPELIIYPYLQPGERLLWTGRPRQGLVLRGAEWRGLLGSLMWAVVALVFVANLWRAGLSLTDLVAGAALLLYALYSTLGRVVLAAWLRSRTHYAVTDRRILIIRGRDQGAVQSVDLKPDAQVTPDIRADGSGSITFSEGQLVATGRRGRRARRRAPPAFEDIPDAQQVHALIQQVMQARHTSYTRRG